MLDFGFWRIRVWSGPTSNIQHPTSDHQDTKPHPPILLMWNGIDKELEESGFQPATTAFGPACLFCSGRHARLKAVMAAWKAAPHPMRMPHTLRVSLPESPESVPPAPKRRTPRIAGRRLHTPPASPP